MRRELEKRNGHRGVFTAIYSKPGARTRRGHAVPMLLFLHVCDAHGHKVADHILFDARECWKKLGLQPGEQVQFCARVRPYTKGYRDARRRDYRLAFPTDIRVLLRPTPDDPAQPGLL